MKQNRETQDMPHGIVGFRFAHALISGDFEKAHEMLSSALKLEYAVATLKQNYDDMMAYVQPVGQPDVFVSNNKQMKGAEQLDSEGWTYVAIVGDGWSEAVTITVKPIGADYLITELVWGRP